MKSIYFFAIALFIFSTSEAQEIAVKSGFWKLKYYQNDDEISKEKFENILSTNTAAFDKWTKGKKQENLWWTFAGLEGGFAVWFFAVNGDAKAMITPAIGMVSSFAIGSVYFFKSINSKKKALIEYNREFDNNTTFRLFPIGSKDGLGLALRF